MNPIIRRLGAKKLYILLLVFILISDFLILYYDKLQQFVSFIIPINLHFVIQILQNSFAFMTFTFILGFLILLVLKMETDIWETILYSVGLSVATLMLVGLFINEIYPKFGIEKPLSFFPIFMTFNILILVLWIFGLFLNKDIVAENKKITLFSNIKITTLTIMILLLPVLSIDGVILMNKTGNNILLVLILLIIPIIIIFLFLFSTYTPEKIYPLAIWMISLSILFSYSLRTKHIIGWDSLGEYYVFQLTKNNYYWNMSNYFNAYNSCLSITILPTIYSRILKIGDEYIFKLFYQLIYSLISVSLYKLYKNFGGITSALLACFFFVSQETFPVFIGNIRTGIALFFYTLIFVLLFNKKLDYLNIRILFLLLIMGIVFSHYSSSYIFFTLLFLSMISIFIFNKILRKKDTARSSFSLIIVSLTMVVIWSLYITKLPAENLGWTVNRSIFTLSEFFSDEFRSKDSLSMIGIGLEQKLPDHIFYINLIVNTIMKFSIIIGLLYILLGKEKYKFDIYFVAFSSFSAIFFGIYIILPFISTAYSLYRILLQMLVFLSIVVVIGINILFQKTKTKNFFILLTFLLFFLSQTGLIGHFYDVKTIALDNSGESFERYTVSDKEIISSRFLSILDLKETFIYADRYAFIRLWGFGGISYPGTFKYYYTLILNSKRYIKNGYLYLGDYNVRMRKIKEWDQRTKDVVDVDIFNFDYFFNISDKIYDNGGSQIWLKMS